jgi:phosphatidylinositol glycan class U
VFSFAIAHALGAACTLAALLFTSYLISGSWQFLSATYGTYLTLPDLTPNVGLWWYFFTEMFDSFRSFFLGVFWLHTFSYLPGMTIRFRKQPLFVIVLLTGISSIFLPYPSIGDVALFLGLLPLYRHVFPLMTYGFLTTAGVLYATLLGPAFYHLWIYAGSGNANFFYAITLVWSLGLTVLLADTLTAVLKDELECERPEMRGKEIKAI